VGGRGEVRGGIPGSKISKGRYRPGKVGNLRFLRKGKVAGQRKCLGRRGGQYPLDALSAKGKTKGGGISKREGLPFKRQLWWN